MKDKIMTLIVIVFIFVSGIYCDNNGKDFLEEYKKVTDTLIGKELFTALQSLDQKYQNKQILKVDIGNLLLMNGDYDLAEIYLKKAEVLNNPMSDSIVTLKMYKSLALLYYLKKDYGRSIEYAEKVKTEKNIETEEYVELRLILANAYFEENNFDKSYFLFQSAWDYSRNIWIKKDYINYINILVKKNDYLGALEAYGEYQEKYLYEIGLGTQESIIYEKLGLIDESILCAFKDLEYLFYYGLIENKQVIEKLKNLKIKLEDENWNKKKLGLNLFTALFEYAMGNWSSAYTYIKKTELKYELPFYKYLFYVIKINTGDIQLVEMEQFVKIEKYFKNLPGFYVNLWRGLKKIGKNYSYYTIKDILEKQILLAPKTVFAMQARIELGQLLNITENESECILLGEELDDIFNRIISGENPEILLPIINLISIKENVYELAGILILKKLITIDRIKKYLLEIKKSATGRLAERIDSILIR